MTTETQIRELPLTFIGRGEVRGFHFRQVTRTESGYIYEVRHEGGVHYEVFRRVINPRFGRVSYPGSKSFGFIARTAKTLDFAFRWLLTLSEEKEG